MQTAATFDHTSPDVVGPQFWDAIREVQRRGPLVWVESNGGYWAATSYDMVLRVLQDWHSFSSAEGTVHPNRPSPEAMPYVMPLDFDPPRQRPYRRQVNPYLTPQMVAPLERPIRDIADELVDAFVDRGSCDLCVDFARKFPGTVFFRLVVRSTDEEFRRVEPQARVMTFARTQEDRARAGVELRAWAQRVFDSRDGQPEERDIVDAVMHLRDTGAPFADHELTSGLAILAQGGIGTSASVIASVMRLLAEHPDVQQRVRDDPGLVPNVVEEGVRLEPPLPLMFRTITRDLQIDGHALKKGQKLCVMFGAANRDPAVFDGPDEFDIDRPHVNRHLSFGAGPHRCIGSNLARLQIRVALEQLTARLGRFWIPAGAVLEYSSHQARSLSSMPLEFSRPA